MLPTKFQFIWPSGFRGEDFQKSIRNKNCLWHPCLLMNRDEMSNRHRCPSKDASLAYNESFKGIQAVRIEFVLY